MVVPAAVHSLVLDALTPPRAPLAVGADVRPEEDSRGSGILQARQRTHQAQWCVCCPHSPSEPALSLCIVLHGARTGGAAVTSLSQLLVFYISVISAGARAAVTSFNGLSGAQVYAAVSFTRLGRGHAARRELSPA